jgi:large subunit ribosomal protein L5
MHIRKNDNVMVIAGKERGKTGKILKVAPEKNGAIIERVNLVKRHTRGRGPQQPGGILEKEAFWFLTINERLKTKSRIMVERLKKKYQDEIIPAMMKEFNYKNPLQVPRLEKITVNVGLGEALLNIKALDSVAAEVTAITGQKPVITKAKKDIANFKLRKGAPIGCMVTLRRERMYEFLDRLIHVALPRVRDFKGVSDRSFDRHGNYSLGVHEQAIFPEIHLDNVEKERGLTVSIVTTAKTDREGKALLKYLGMPFAA